MTLNELFTKHNCDKSDSIFACHGYANTYETLLQDFPPDLTLLEIGVWDPRAPGAGSRAWREYLPDARLIGLDINPGALALRDELGMEVYTADQSDPLQLHSVMRSVGPVDFVIDDGSHVLHHIETSMRVIWPFLRDGAYYCVEDLDCPQAQPASHLNWVASDLRAEGFWDRDKLLVLRRPTV